MKYKKTNYLAGIAIGLFIMLVGFGYVSVSKEDKDEYAVTPSTKRARKLWYGIDDKLGPFTTKILMVAWQQA
jgi:hypothetical protein